LPLVTATPVGVPSAPTSPSVGVPGSAEIGVNVGDPIEELPEPLTFVAVTVKV